MVRERGQDGLRARGSSLVPRLPRQEREIEVVQAIYIRVPGEPGNEASMGVVSCLPRARLPARIRKTKSILRWKTNEIARSLIIT